jgi:predicted nucleotidyltransferase
LKPLISIGGSSHFSGGGRSYFTNNMFLKYEQKVHILKTITIFMLSKLLSSKERLKVLEYILYRNSFKVTEVSKELTLSKGFVSEFLTFLYKKKLIDKKNHYCLSKSPLVNALKLLLNVNKIDVSKIKKSYFKGIGLYGSWANGTNMYDSDLDIWIKVDVYPDENEIASLSKTLRKMTNSEIQLLILTPKKIKQIKSDKPFFSSLYYSSYILWGESIE